MVRASLRVAITHAHSWPEVRRGGERYLHELAAALGRRGHEVTVFGGASEASDSSADAVRTIRLDRGPADDQAEARFARAVYPRLLAGRFDVVHSLGPHDAVASIRAARLRRRRTTVFTTLGNPVREWWDEQPHRALHDRVVADIDVYGCLSTFALQALETDFRRRGAITPGGVDLDVFRPAGRLEAQPTLLYSGALDEWRKGLDVLLEAVALMTTTLPDLRLWLTGSGDPSAVLNAAPPEAAARTEVLDLGRPDELPAVYSGAWATVLPAVHEAFGLVLVESLACGTPVIGADHAGIPELVAPAVGRLAAPRDARALAEACLEVLGRRPGESREACRAAAEPHGWDGVAERTEAVYRQGRR